MLMSAFFSPAPTQPIPISLAIDPVYNALNSIALLNEVARMPALDEWVVRTAASLAPEQRRANHLIFAALSGALLPHSDWPDFPSYLADLAAQPAGALRDRAIECLGGAPADADALAAQFGQLSPEAEVAALAAEAQ